MAGLAAASARRIGGLQLSDLAEAARRDFLADVGTIMARWAEVDDLLFQLFWMGVKVDRSIAAIIYYRISTIGGRKELLDEILEHLLKPEPRKTWDAISVGFRAQIKYRNQVAHERPTEPLAPTEIAVFLDDDDDTWAGLEFIPAPPGHLLVISAWGEEAARPRRARSKERQDLSPDDLREVIRNADSLIVDLKLFLASSPFSTR